MKTCETCKFLAAEREKSESYYDNDDGTFSQKETNYRTCVKVIHGNADFDYIEKATEQAMVLDGSGYAARLVVLPTFGCILHEEKE